MLVEAEPTDQDLETAIENAYQEMDPENPVFVIRQKINNGKYHSCELWCRHHRKAWTTVQAFLTTGWTTRTMTSLMTLTHTWSMARDTETRRHLKMLFTDSGAATQLTCGVTHTMTHDDSQ